MRIAPLLLRPFCSHPETILKVNRKQHRLYTECVHCLHTSPGISTEKTFVPVSSRTVADALLNHMLGGAHARIR